jgi:hypothetical protein
VSRSEIPRPRTQGPRAEHRGLSRTMVQRQPWRRNLKLRVLDAAQPLTVTSVRIMSPHLTDPDRWVVAAPLSTGPRRCSLPRSGRGSPGPGRPEARATRNDSQVDLSGLYQMLTVSHEKLSTQPWSRTGPPPVEFSSAACSMQRRPLTASSVRPWVLTPPIRPEGDRGPRRRRVPRGTPGRSCSAIPGPVPRASR